MKYIKNFRSDAFTLAEILLSLTVIGIVAAIALPSLLGNANERAWETQKKALYTRFSQSIPLLPSLNGYGELVGNLPSATGDDLIPEEELKDTAAETFVRDGLSKVMKITNICDNDHLSDCGLPDKIIPLMSAPTVELSAIKTYGDFNQVAQNLDYTSSTNVHYHQEQVDTKAVAFETVNGESILVYYNPACQPYLEEGSSDWYYIQPKICANFVYDLNGKKGPNTVGKDIGFITTLYSTDSVVIAPNPYPTIYDRATQISSGDKCKNLDIGAKVPNIDEMSSLFFNMKLVGISDGTYWSSTTLPLNKGWYQSFIVGRRNKSDRSGVHSLICVKK